MGGFDEQKSSIFHDISAERTMWRIEKSTWSAMLGLVMHQLITPETTRHTHEKCHD